MDIMDSIYEIIGRLQVTNWTILGGLQEIVISLQNRVYKSGH